MASSDIPGDINQAKKRPVRPTSFSDNQSGSTAAGTQMMASSMPPLARGMELTPGQQTERRQTEQRKAMGQRLDQTRQNVGGAIGDFATKANDRLLDTVTGGPARRLIANTTFDSSLPRQDVRDRQRAQQAQSFVRDNPERAASADQFGQGVIGRTLTAGLRTQQPSPMAVAGGPQPAMPATSKPQTAAPAANNPAQQQAPSLSIAQPTAPQGQPDRVMPDNARAGEMGNVGYGGIVGRRNEQGVQEFSNAQGDVEAAAGKRFSDPKSKVGNGIGGLSIVSGGEEAMARNNRATAIMQQTRLENSGPGLLVGGTRGDDGAEGAINRQDRKDERGRRDQQNNQREQAIAQGVEGLNSTDAARKARDLQERQLSTQEQRAKLGDSLTRQQIEQGSLAIEDQRRLRDLRGIIANPNASDAEQQQARRALQELSNSDAQVRAEAVRDAARQRMVADFYKTYSEQSSYLKPEDRVPFEEWLAPAMQAINGRREQLESRGLKFEGTHNGNSVYSDASGKRFIDE